MESLQIPYRAVVVGATGGLGAAFVEHLEKDPNCGCVVALGRHSEPPVDLLDETSIERAAGWLRKQAPEWDLILDATGILTIDGHGPEKRLRDLDPAIMARSFAINAIGPALLFKHLAPLLPRLRKGILATLSARVGSIEDNQLGGWVSYRAAKAALNQIVRTTALELRFSHRQATVIALQPGTCATRLSEPYRARAPEVLAPEYASGELLKVLDRLDATDSGSFYDFEGQRLPF
ncbi:MULTISPECIES: SDR family NAD(P)-dependent oxidoreductase [unclassified Thioalkalivibrio]|uniref:SDR family NAD(P)-dependent oxidoreductase n=1 Tax=unclassified Thioalkalivibrio TaxID=2621013 RepID=UPI000362412C|nr:MULTISPECIES: SDR family NAD(P)-dependent oxidoreductase [unclassified Thioalkalivibrio]